MRLRSVVGLLAAFVVAGAAGLAGCTSGSGDVTVHVSPDATAAVWPRLLRFLADPAQGS